MVFNESLSRRNLFAGTGLFALGMLSGAGGVMLLAEPRDPFEKARTQALPPDGLETDLVLGPTLRRLTKAGVISPRKLALLYERRGGTPPFVQRLLDDASEESIVLSPSTAEPLLNLLWPLGLANRTDYKARSPLAGAQLPKFASTAGWILGEAESGAVYFNTVEVLSLGQAESQTVVRLATAIHRPCCDNDTLFQDCNHGSAMLGLLELGAAQGLSERALWRIALVASAYWFPDEMTKVALYFNEVDGQGFDSVTPSEILDRRLFSASGQRLLVRPTLAARGLVPRAVGSGAGCAV